MGSTLIEGLVERAQTYPEKTAYVFLADGAVESARLTYGQLDLRARALAAALAKQGGRFERVLLLFPPGLEFIESFFGCMYSGSIAVPLPAPDPARLKR